MRRVGAAPLEIGLPPTAIPDSAHAIAPPDSRIYPRAMPVATPQSTTALILICAPPQQGAGPVRLTAAFGPRLACLVEWAVQECAMEDLLHWSGRRYLAVNSDDVSWAEGAVEDRAEVLIQPAGSFGSRLVALDVRLRAQGVERMIYLGAIAPAMNPVCLDAAAAALARGETVIGPVSDGRAALLGTARGWPALDPLQFHRSTAAGRVANGCRRAGHDLAFVNPGVTISCIADIEACSRELEGDPRPARARLRFLLSALGAEVVGSRQQLREVQAARCGAAPAHGPPPAMPTRLL